MKNLFFSSLLILLITACKEVKEEKIILKTETPEYFNLRPEVEKAFGYTHAVKIGDDIKISGAVSMDDKGNPTAKGDMVQQIKNCSQFVQCL